MEEDEDEVEYIVSLLWEMSDRDGEAQGLDFVARARTVARFTAMLFRCDIWGSAVSLYSDDGMAPPRHIRSRTQQKRPTKALKQTLLTPNSKAR